MMQLVTVSAEKMKLYNIWNSQNWDEIINSDVRTKLLNDDYEISNDLDKYIGRGSIISFKTFIFCFQIFSADLLSICSCSALVTLYI